MYEMNHLPRTHAMNITLPSGPLIMVVEDDLLVASTLEIALELKDYRILGPVETVEEALKLLETQSPDVALIDYRLATSTSEKLLAPLRERHIPVCVLTGLSADELPVNYAGCRVLQKPLRLDTLLDALAPVIAQ
jgi:ActR/RegA family two-component response regulator